MPSSAGFNALLLQHDARCQLPDRQRYLLMGDATRPVSQVILAEGLALPQRPLSSLPFRLKILHFNDLHGHIARLTPHDDAPLFSPMVGRLAHLRQRYAGDPHTAVLFLSAGDDMSGSLFDEWLIPPGYHGHAAYQAYSAAGLDAAVIGNHDLDLGTAVLAQAIDRDAHFPLLSANLRGTALQGLVYPAALLAVKGVRVGIIGVTTGAQGNGPDRQQVQFTDPLASVCRLLPTLRPLCDVLIILSHLGYRFDADSAAGGQFGDEALARRLPPGSFDLIIGGHTHHAINEHGLSHHRVVNGIPIVQAGTMGRFLGEVTVTLGGRYGENGRPAVTHAHLLSTTDLPPDPTFEEAAVQPLVRRLLPVGRRPLGLAIDHPDLSPEAVHNDLAAGESALANFVTAGMLARARARGYAVDLAMTDAAVLRDGLPVGPLTFADWFALMPYADTFCLYRVTGEQLLRLLDDNARRAERPAEPHLERGFLHFSGAVRYAIDLGPSRAAARAVQAQVYGRSLTEQLSRTFTMVTHSFVRQLARPWETAACRAGLPLLNLQEWPVQPTPHFLRREMVDYVVAHGGVTEEGGAMRDGRLHIMPHAVPAFQAE